MHIFWSYLKPYRWLVFLSLLLARLSHLFTLVEFRKLLSPGELISMGLSLLLFLYRCKTLKHYSALPGSRYFAAQLR